MLNPFETADSSPTAGDEEELIRLLSPASRERLSPEAGRRIVASMDQALSTIPPARSISAQLRRLAIGGAALVLPLAAVTAVGALSGHVSFQAPMHTIATATSSAVFGNAASPGSNDSESDVAGTDSDTEQTPHANGHGCDDINHAAGQQGGDPVGCTVGNSGDHRQNGETSKPTASTTATPTATGNGPSDAATAAHANGHGCDDVNHSDDEQGGDPVGCTVGNSGDHRSNGDADNSVTPTLSPSVTAPTATTTTAQSPHENGHGCDDVNHAAGSQGGDPVGCTVGNSGTHRQDGTNHGSDSASGTPTSAANQGHGEH